MYFRFRSCDEITLCHALTVRCWCPLDTLKRLNAIKLSVSCNVVFFRELLRSAFFTLPSFQVHRSKDILQETNNRKQNSQQLATHHPSYCSIWHHHTSLLQLLALVPLLPGVCILTIGSEGGLFQRTLPSLRGRRISLELTQMSSKRPRVIQGIN